MKQAQEIIETGSAFFPVVTQLVLKELYEPLLCPLKFLAGQMWRRRL